MPVKPRINPAVIVPSKFQTPPLSENFSISPGAVVSHDKACRHSCRRDSQGCQKEAIGSSVRCQCREHLGGKFVSVCPSWSARRCPRWPSGPTFAMKRKAGHWRWPGYGDSVRRRNRDPSSRRAANGRVTDTAQRPVTQMLVPSVVMGVAEVVARVEKSVSEVVLLT